MDLLLTASAALAERGYNSMYIQRTGANLPAIDRMVKIVGELDRHRANRKWRRNRLRSLDWDSKTALRPFEPGRADKDLTRRRPLHDRLGVDPRQRPVHVDPPRLEPRSAERVG